MSGTLRCKHCAERGVGLIEVMISVIIGMLMVLVIFQVYEVSEGQKRTITAGSDAQQNASYGLYALTRDLSMAGNGIASTAAALDQCAMLRPIPVLIEAGATADDPDSITVLYGGSSSLSTPVQFKQTATPAENYVVPGPVGFSADPADPDKTDLIAAVQGANCTVSRINPGGVAVNAATGEATLAHTPIAGSIVATYTAGNASLVNLGPASAVGRIAYTIPAKCKDDPAACALRTQNQLPAAGPVTPVISDAVNLKAQYGLDTTIPPDGIVDTWQEATKDTIWSAANLPLQPLATLRQIRAVRVAIVTRSAQYEKEPVTTGDLPLLNDTVTMTITGDQQRYRYKVLETIVPLRNALWNTE